VANPWFRLYSEFASDHKIQMMSEADQRRFVMLLCLRCCNGDVTLHDTEIAFQLRVTAEEWAATKAVFLARNLIDSTNKIVAWDRRQFVSDSSAARVAKHRERKKQACNVTVTPPDTDTDTDTDTEKPKNKAPKPPKFDLPAWLPDTVWGDYVEMRRRIRKPMTAKAMALAVAELDKLRAQGHAPVAVIQQSIMNSWQGLFPLKDKGGRFPLQTTISKPDFSGLEICDDGTYKF
jgi:hypothetical protein